MLKAFQCDDHDLYAANDAEEAKRLWHEHVGGDELMHADYPRELTDAQLDAAQFEYEDNEAATGGTTSVRQMLEEHGPEPGWLAGSDW